MNLYQFGSSKKFSPNFGKILAKNALFQILNLLLKLIRWCVLSGRLNLIDLLSAVLTWINSDLDRAVFAFRRSMFSYILLPESATRCIAGFCAASLFDRALMSFGGVCEGCFGVVLPLSSA